MYAENRGERADARRYRRIHIYLAAAGRVRRAGGRAADRHGG